MLKGGGGNFLPILVKMIKFGEDNKTIYTVTWVYSPFKLCGDMGLDNFRLSTQIVSDNTCKSCVSGFIDQNRPL